MAEKISVFKSLESEALYYQAYDRALKMWPVPYDDIYIPTRFGDTHVIASGAKESPPLILLQPAGAGAIIWCRNVANLSQHFRVYALDTISEVNKSVLTRPIKSNMDFNDWIIDLFEALKIVNSDIVGNSFGGFIALQLVISHPELVKRAVLISPAASFMMMWPSFWHVFIPTYIIAPLIKSEQLVVNSYQWMWQDLPQDETIQKLRLITALNGLPRHGPPTVFKDPELQQIHTPILLLIGDHEVIYNPEVVIERATRLVPGLKAEIVPRANHNAEFTAPEFINEKILEFLEQK